MNRYRGTERRADHGRPGEVKVIHQSEQISSVVPVRVASELRTVGAAVWQFISNTGEATHQLVHDHDEGFCSVGHAVYEHNRRPTSPDEVTHPVANRIEHAAVCLCPECGL